jgi:uncharacterized membrane protein
VVRAIVRTGLLLAVNAVALIVASIFLKGFGINVTGFLVALLIFTACVALLTPFFVSRLERRRGLAVMGLTLVATLLSLIITDILSDGFDISGMAWLWTTLIVWGASALAPVILPFFGLRRYYEKRDDRR